MRNRILTWVAGGIVALALGGPFGAAWAQSPRTDAAVSPPARPEAAPPRAEADRPPRIEEVKPSVYLLRDPKDGTMQAVINIPYEQFRQYWESKNQPASQDRQPPFTLYRLSLSGTASGENVELQAQASVQVRTENWVRVPLLMNRGYLRPDPQFRGNGEYFLHYDAEQGGHNLWIRGQPGAQYELSMKMLVPTTAAGDETRMRLALPRATTSELKLKVPVGEAQVRVSERAVLQQTSPAGRDTTEAVISGLGGDFEVAWRKPGAASAGARPTLEASGTILARVDTSALDFEATLNVRSYGGAFDSFDVRLPQGTEFVPATAAGYTVAAVPNAGNAPVVKVTLPKKTAGPVDVRLAARRTPAPRSGQEMDLAGFEVVGAVRQWGELGIAVTSDLLLLWGSHRGVRQMDQPGDALKRESLAASFEYYTQPFSLKARLEPRKTRIHVEPDYRISVESDQAKLDARLKYTVHGTKVNALEITLPDWEIDEVGPENLVQTDGWELGDDRVLTVPLMRWTIGAIEVRLKAHRALGDGQRTLSLPLPQPKANSTAAATVVIAPADNVRLLPDREACVGLVRDLNPPAIRQPAYRPPPLYFTQTSAAKAVFVAEMRTYGQSIHVDMESTLALDDRRMEQRLKYDISYVPADSLTFAVPRELAATGDVQFLMDDQPQPTLILPEADEAEPGRTSRMRVTLLGAALGPRELTVRYPLPVPPLAANGKALRLRVPMVVPEDGELGENRLTIAAPPELTVESRGADWQVVDGPTLHDRSRILQLRSDKKPDQVDLSIERAAERDTGTTVVDRAWIQTWLTGDGRQDRAVFRVMSDRRSLTVSLPAGAPTASAEVRLDGQRAAFTVAAEGRLRIPLAGEGPNRVHLLELRYHVAERPARGGMTLDLPRLGSNVWSSRLYWQLILPANEHIVSAPEGFTPESTWSWMGYYWGRRPTLEQPDLEAWSGGARRPPVPENTNRYLFSGLGHIESAELRTASRTAVVLWASGLALSFGLVLTYVPAARRPLSIVGIVFALLVLAAIYPTVAILAVQAAAIGLLLAVAAALLARSASRHAAHARSSREGGSSRTQLYGAWAGKPPSTPSAPAVGSAVTPEMGP